MFYSGNQQDLELQQTHARDRNFHRPGREAGRKCLQSSSQVARHSLRGGGQEVFPTVPSSSLPSCCPWQAQLAAPLGLMIWETTPFVPFSLQSFFPPFHLPASCLKDIRVNCKCGRCKAKFIVSCLSLTSCQAVPPLLSANSIPLSSPSYPSRVTSTSPSPGCLSTLVPSLLFHRDCPGTHLLYLFPGSLFWLMALCPRSSF